MNWRPVVAANIRLGSSGSSWFAGPDVTIDAKVGFEIAVASNLWTITAKVIDLRPNVAIVFKCRLLWTFWAVATSGLVVANLRPQVLYVWTISLTFWTEVLHVRTIALDIGAIGSRSWAIVLHVGTIATGIGTISLRIRAVTLYSGAIDSWSRTIGSCSRTIVNWSRTIAREALDARAIALDSRAIALQGGTIRDRSGSVASFRWSKRFRDRLIVSSGIFEG